MEENVGRGIVPEQPATERTRGASVSDRHDTSAPARHATERPLITPVKVPKPAELFADMLRDKIFTGEFPTGEALPPERVLVEQSQLSRSTVREALGVLKQQGLLVTRPGRTGGSIVSTPTQQDLVDSIDVYVQSQGWNSDTRTLVETREIIEPWCAALAAHRRTDAQLDEMRRQNDSMKQSIDRLESYLAASSTFHLTVASASHNALLSAFMHASRQALMTGSSATRFHERATREHTWKTHREITDAIADCDAARAYDLMGGHVRAGEQTVAHLLES